MYGSATKKLGGKITEQLGGSISIPYIN